MLNNKKWWKAALTRALRTVAQTLVGSLPVGFALTADVVRSADWTGVFYHVLAWLGTGVLAGAASLLTSLGGLPEVESED